MDVNVQPPGGLGKSAGRVQDKDGSEAGKASRLQFRGIAAG